MSKLNLLTGVIAASALLVGTAGAAPANLATPLHVNTTCRTVVKDVNGKVIGQRTTNSASQTEVVGNVLRPSKPAASYMTAGPFCGATN